MAAHQSVFSVMAFFVLRFRVQLLGGHRFKGSWVHGFSPAAGHKKADLIEEENLTA